MPGRGLEGDRYYSGTGTFSPTCQKPDFEITFIEQERIDAFARESTLQFTALHARRNIVTVGVDLNELVGREFHVGEVHIRGLRLCERCNYPAWATSSIKPAEPLPPSSTTTSRGGLDGATT